MGYNESKESLKKIDKLVYRADTFSREYKERRERNIIIAAVVIVILVLIVMYFTMFNTKYRAWENQDGEWVLTVDASTAIYVYLPEKYDDRKVDKYDLDFLYDEEKCPFLDYAYFENSDGEFYKNANNKHLPFSYIVYDEYVELYRYYGEENDVTVPKVIAGKPVTIVNDKCFEELEERLKQEQTEKEHMEAEAKAEREKLEAEAKAKAEQEKQEAEAKAEREWLEAERERLKAEREKLEAEAKAEEELLKQEQFKQLEEYKEEAREGILINKETVIKMGCSAEDVAALCEGQELVYKKISRGFVISEETPMVRRIRSDNQGCEVYGNTAASVWYQFNSEDELREIVVKWEKNCFDDLIFESLKQLYGEPGTDWIYYLGVTEVFRWDLDNGLSVFWRPEIYTDYSYSEALLLIGYTEDLSLKEPPEDLGTYLSEYYQY